MTAWEISAAIKCARCELTLLRSVLVFIFGIALFSGALWADGNDAFLVFEQRGAAEWQSTATNQSNAPATWSPLREGLYLPGRVRIRTGEASWVRLWLRPSGKFSLGEKSVAEIRYLSETSKLYYQCQLGSGKMGLEVVRYDANSFYEVFASDIQIRTTLGHFLASFYKETGLAEIYQVTGETLVSPRLQDGKLSKTDILPFREMTLKKSQRVAFRDFRFNLREFQEAGPEWAFAFQPIRDRKSDMMDLKRKWE